MYPSESTFAHVRKISPAVSGIVTCYSPSFGKVAAQALWRPSIPCRCEPFAFCYSGPQAKNLLFAQGELRAAISSPSMLCYNSGDLRHLNDTYGNEAG
jgi:hypothetical protein